TTGKPKAVMHSQRNFVLTGQSYPAWMGMERGDRIYACLPLFHINSQAYSTMGAIGARGAIVLVPRFSASRFWSDIKRHRVAVFNFIGAMTLILSKKEPEPGDTDHVVKVAYGVPALPGDLRDELEARYGMRIVSGFGMSETTFGLLEPFAERRRAGSMGFPRPHPDPHRPSPAPPGTLAGSPASSDAIRATFRLSSPDWFAAPRYTSSTRAPSIPLRATTSRTTCAARSSGRTEDSAPP
ncbi:MAG: AMP-binding protein, partial [Phycisphaerales bacterium]|nr:AMP-binding protein [Phycisphaerales bacterium]